MLNKLMQMHFDRIFSEYQEFLPDAKYEQLFGKIMAFLYDTMSI